MWWFWICVQRGLKDGKKIVMKRLDKISQDMREFLAKVNTIGRIHHFNLVNAKINGSSFGNKSIKID